MFVLLKTLAKGFEWNTFVWDGETASTIQSPNEWKIYTFQIAANNFTGNSGCVNSTFPMKLKNWIKYHAYMFNPFELNASFL